MRKKATSEQLDILHRQDPALHRNPSAEVIQAQNRLRGETSTERPHEKIGAWLDIWEEVLTEARQNPDVVANMKQLAHALYVMKPEDVPQSFFDRQQQLARDEGRPVPEITPELRNTAADVIIRDSQASLDYWIDYFSSSDADGYPTWLKYWAFNGMTKLRPNPDAHVGEGAAPAFISRDKDTVASYPELNQEALARVMDVMEKKYSKEYLDLLQKKQAVKKQIETYQNYDKLKEGIQTKKALLQESEQTDLVSKHAVALTVQIARAERTLAAIPTDAEARQDTISTLTTELAELETEQRTLLGYQDSNKSLEDIEELLSHNDFRTLYNEAFEQLVQINDRLLQVTRGEWRKYDQGGDHMALVHALNGQGTGWCTAGEGFAAKQLKDGDFYIYFSEDDEGMPTIPRLAIRMEKHDEQQRIAEVRGRAEKQNLDPYIDPVLTEKLAEFPDGEQYRKKSEDMARLKQIYQKQTTSQKDPTRYAIFEDPLTPEDLYFLYEIDGKKIEGFGYGHDPRIKEILDARRAEGIDIKQDLFRALQLQYPDITPEQISVGKINSKEELSTEHIVYHHGYLYLPDVTSLEGVTLPEHIGEDLDLPGVTSLEGVTLPEHIGGDLDLFSVTSLEGVTLPEHIGGDLYLSKQIDKGSITALPDDIQAKIKFIG